MILSDRKYLDLPLPEDVEKRKMHGDFAKAEKLIDRKLALDTVPLCMKKRLEIEKEILHTLRVAYPYSLTEALEMVQKEIPSFTMNDLEEMVNQNVMDWYYLDGEIHLIETFLDNLAKVNHPLLKRPDDPEAEKAFQAKQKRLNDSMADMEANGGAAYRYTIRASLKINPDKVQEGKKILVHLPVPTMGTQISKISILNHTNCPSELAPEDHQSRTISFCKELAADDEFFVEYSFENRTPYVELDPAKADSDQPDFYLNEQEPHIIFTPLIRDLCQVIVGDETNPVIKARKIYDYITTNIRYSFVRPYSTLHNIPEYAAANGKGDCGVQALLFITMCRYAGVPAKWQSGLYLGKEDIGSHDWAQFYIAPYGWVFADLSFGGSSHRVGNEERRRFYFGNLDPFRMVANTEFQHEFYPAKGFTRYDPTDNQFGEAEYEDAPLGREDYACQRLMVKMEKIDY